MNTIKRIITEFFEHEEMQTLDRNGKPTGTANSYKNVITNIFKYLKMSLDGPFNKLEVLLQIEQMIKDSKDRTAFYNKYNELIELSPPSHSEKGFIIPAINRFYEFLKVNRDFQYIDIYVDSIKPTNLKDFQFSWDYISKGGKKRSHTYLEFKNAIFISGNQRITRKYIKNEQRASGMVLARLAIQVFENELDNLTEDERRKIKTDGTLNTIGFWNDIKQLSQQWGNGANAGTGRSYVADKYLNNGYPSNLNAKYYFYNAGLYDSIFMAQNLLKKFGKTGDYFRVTVSQSGGRKNDKDQVIEAADLDSVENIYSYEGRAENKIFYGVPGSGKSFSIKEEIRKIVRKDGNKLNDEEYYDFEKTNTIRTIFHPDYTYSDFSGQILPRTKDGDIDYSFIPGPFTKILKDACRDPNKPFFLIIEEINRGNAAAIFGDIFQLLDRDKSGYSEYEIDSPEISKIVNGIKDDDTCIIPKIKLPQNLWLFATMNTSDQNVFTLDTAFQRRWDMKLIRNMFKPQDVEEINHDFLIKGTGITWRKFATVVNGLLAEQDGVMSSEDKSLGAWFVKPDEADGQIVSSERFANKVLKYLWDDAFKFEREKFFNTAEYKTLEMLLYGFEKLTTDKGFGNLLSIHASTLLNNETTKEAD